MRFILATALLMFFCNTAFAEEIMLNCQMLNDFDPRLPRYEDKRRLSRCPRLVYM